MPAKSSVDIDWPTFAISMGTVVGVSLFLFAAPDTGSQWIDNTFAFLTEKTGILFVWSAIGTLLFLVAVAVSPFRSIKLGSGEDPPTHSTLSWAGMLFSTGIGTAILYWGTIEWIEYYNGPPFGLDSQSPEALQWATSYSMFHWGIVGWALYCLPAVCISYAYHVRKEPSLNLAASCAPLLKRHSGRWPGRVINCLFMVGLLGSASTGIGLTTPLITESFITFFGGEPSFGLTVGAIVLVVGLIAFSVGNGLDRGIKRLSNLNLYLMFALLGTMVVLGPTLFIWQQGIKSFGFMLRHFPEMVAIGYPAENASFTEGWTVFYWAWWMALGPFVGMFICKISRGRTLGQLIWGVLGFGTLGCTLCFVVFGGYSLHLDQEQGQGIIAAFADNKYGAVIQVVTSLPLGKWILPLFFLLCVSFAATTYDSASYTLAAAATRRLPVDEDPARWHRIVWAVLSDCSRSRFFHSRGLEIQRSDRRFSCHCKLPRSSSRYRSWPLGA